MVRKRTLPLSQAKPDKVSQSTRVAFIADGINSVAAGLKPLVQDRACHVCMYLPVRLE